MESTNAFKIASRQAMLEVWLRTDCGLSDPVLKPLPGEAAGFRRYYRVSTPKGSFVAVDAEISHESAESFIAISCALRKQGLEAPEVIEVDLEAGFFLLTDFGDATYLRNLNEVNADELYGRALRALSIMQGCQKLEGLTLPAFDSKWMLDEWSWHKEWFLNKLLNLSPGDREASLDQAMSKIIDSAVSQAQVFMHRDYHSANLMVLPGKVGILDFQDAFIGPVTYDLASLLRDCYIDWPEAKVRKWVLFYFQLLREKNVLSQVDEQTFLRWFDLMGLQRHIKALFTFARKRVRDNDPAWLAHVPRTLAYILKASQPYPELAPIYEYYKQVVTPAFNEQKETLCEQ